MDLQGIFNIVLGIALGLSAWIVRTLWSAVAKLTSDLALLREEIAKDYVSKSDWKDSIKEIKDLLLQIAEKLDRKADK